MKQKKLIFTIFIMAFIMTKFVFANEVDEATLDIFISVDKVFEDLGFVVTDVEDAVILEDEKFTINIKKDDFVFTVNGVQHFNYYKTKKVDEIYHIPFKNISNEIGAIMEIDSEMKNLMITYNGKTASIELGQEVNLSEQNERKIETLEDLKHLDIIYYEEVIMCMEMIIKEYESIIANEQIDLEQLQLLKNNVLELQKFANRKEFKEDVNLFYFAENMINVIERNIYDLSINSKSVNETVNKDFELAKIYAMEYVKEIFNYYNMNKMYNEIINGDEENTVEQTILLIDVMSNTVVYGVNLTRYAPDSSIQVFNIIKEQTLLLQNISLTNINLTPFINEMVLCCEDIIKAASYYKEGDIANYDKYYNKAEAYFENCIYGLNEQLINEGY